MKFKNACYSILESFSTKCCVENLILIGKGQSQASSHAVNVFLPCLRNEGAKVAGPEGALCQRCERRGW